MGTTCLRCMFKTGYCLYARTCVGRCLHNYLLRDFHKRYGDKAAHTQITPFLFGKDLMITPVPYLLSNYCYVVADLSEGNFVLIDVGDGKLMKHVGTPDAVLTTHKHWDHAGGNKIMKEAHQGLKVYGGKLDKVANTTHVVADGEVLKFGRLEFTAVLTPGHTTGHIVWRLSGKPFGTADSLFTGDHLMLACCGAHFEGSVEQMVKSLEILKKFPDNAWVWPGHEVGLTALMSAIFVDPSNMHTLDKLAWVIKRRKTLKCSCPSTIGEEKKYNPYMRTDDKVLQYILGLRKEVDGNIEEPIIDDPIQLQALCFKRIQQKNEKFPPELMALAELDNNVILRDGTLDEVLQTARNAQTRWRHDPVRSLSEIQPDPEKTKTPIK